MRLCPAVKTQAGWKTNTQLVVIMVVIIGMVMIVMFDNFDKIPINSNEGGEEVRE